MKIAVFPGTFDPITNGHMDIIEKALPIFDKIIVAIGVNSNKKTLFDLDKRLAWIDEIFSDNDEHIAQVNRKLNPDIDTIFVLSSQENSHISSTIVRDIIVYGGDYSQFVPDVVKV